MDSRASFTPDELRDLPHVLAPGQVLRLLNCDRGTLDILRQQHPDIVAYVVRRRQQPRYKYVKAIVFRLAKLDFARSPVSHDTVTPT